MNRYKITYSVTIEAESHPDAIEIFFDSVPRDSEMLQCVAIPPDSQNVAKDQMSREINAFSIRPRGEKFKL